MLLIPAGLSVAGGLFLLEHPSWAMLPANA